MASSQLNKIKYGRPESWNFFFYAKIISQTLAVEPVVTAAVIDVKFHLTIGIGRCSTTVTNFCNFRFHVAAPGDLRGAQIYTASSWGPVRDGNLYPNAPNEIWQFVAEDIQLQADAVYSTGATIGGDSAIVQIDTYFAPVHHSRPEWHLREFPGNEQSGT
jgi:hypothetical protein